MSEEWPVPADEADRMPLPRDPPEPPGYVDPLEGVATLEDDSGPGPEPSGEPPGITQTRSLP